MARRPPSRGSRGATLVEYALIVSIFVAGSTAAITSLDDASGDYYDRASDDIGDLPQADIDTSDNGTIPASLPTAPSSTSTTSTTSTTTTTVPARSTIAEIQDTSDNGGSNDYNARVRVRIRNTKTSNAVSGATVTVYLQDDAGSTTTKSCTTASDGRCSVTWNRSESREPVLAYVYSVSSNPTWDGTPQYIFLYEP